MRIFEVFPFLSFLALILMILVKRVVLKNKGIVSSAKSSNPAIIRIVLYPIFLLILILLIFELLKSAFQFSFTLLPTSITKPLMENTVLQFLGIILLCISLIIMAITLIHFKNSLRFGMNKNNLGNLITAGIFSYSRNPFFLSLEIYFIGIAFFFPKLFFIVLAFSTIVSMHFFIIKEEIFLMENYGNEYKDYTRKVRRYF